MREGREAKLPIPLAGVKLPLCCSKQLLNISGRKLREREQQREESKGASPLQEHLVFPAVGEAGSAHAQVLHQPQVFHLVSDQDLIKPIWAGQGMQKHNQCTAAPCSRQGQRSALGSHTIVFNLQ